MEHAARLTSVELVFSRRLTQTPLEGDSQRTELDGQDTTYTMGAYYNRLQPTAPRAAAESERKRHASELIARAPYVSISSPSICLRR